MRTLVFVIADKQEGQTMTTPGKKKKFEMPYVERVGTVSEVTLQNESAPLTDVPQGTPSSPGPITGS